MRNSTPRVSITVDYHKSEERSSGRNSPLQLLKVLMRGL